MGQAVLRGTCTAKKQDAEEEERRELRVEAQSDHAQKDNHISVYKLTLHGSWYTTDVNTMPTVNPQ